MTHRRSYERGIATQENIFRWSSLFDFLITNADILLLESNSNALYIEISRSCGNSSGKYIFMHLLGDKYVVKSKSYSFKMFK